MPWTQGAGHRDSVVPNTHIHVWDSVCCSRLGPLKRHVSPLTAVATGDITLSFYILLSILSEQNSDWPLLVQLESNQSQLWSTLGDRSVDVWILIQAEHGFYAECARNPLTRSDEISAWSIERRGGIQGAGGHKGKRHISWKRRGWQHSEVTHYRCSGMVRAIVLAMKQSWQASGSL